ncbi:MAG: 50S ribosomal protein L24 [Candidatus Aminicenantes bacterium]|nr:50S ribosomal protein L24 [Candidatus Aminicenantes bacterium]
MPKIALKKNDIVVVTRGKDKGKQGKVLKLFPETNRVIVERINFVKHFVKADRSRNQQGGVMEKEAPISVSNVMLYCSECGQGVRTRTRRLEDGSTIRLCHRCENLIEKQK